jgi:hypothetical protein
VSVGGGGQAKVRLRLSASQNSAPFKDFDNVVAARRREADAF